MSHQQDCFDVLYEIQEIGKNYILLDTETTSLDGEVVQWTVVAPDGTVLDQSYVRPQEPITEEARAIHHISNEMVADAPSFEQVAC